MIIILWGSHSPNAPCGQACFNNSIEVHVTMGKGDKRTKRGKIFRKSYGKSRPRANAKKAAAAAEQS
jgi:30S ribosomal protein S31